jgi:hypothetical protein
MHSLVHVYLFLFMIFIQVTLFDSHSHVTVNNANHGLVIAQVCQFKERKL